jgi:hypothetical protein
MAETRHLRLCAAAARCVPGGARSPRGSQSTAWATEPSPSSAWSPFQEKTSSLGSEEARAAPPAAAARARLSSVACVLGAAESVTALPMTPLSCTTGWMSSRGGTCGSIDSWIQSASSVMRRPVCHSTAHGWLSSSDASLLAVRTGSASRRTRRCRPATLLGMQISSMSGTGLANQRASMPLGSFTPRGTCPRICHTLVRPSAPSAMACATPRPAPCA